MGQVEIKEVGNGSVAVAIDKGKGSQNALKWAVDHLLHRGQTVILIHVNLKPTLAFSASPSLATPWMNQLSDAHDENALGSKQLDQHTREFFLPLLCFCTRKDIHCKVIILEDTDVVKALTEYVSHTAIEHLVIGASSKSGFLGRFMERDIPGTVSEGAPDFCTVYVISKGKISSMRSASRPAPPISPLQNHILNQASIKPDLSETNLPPANSTNEAERRPMEPSYC